MKGDQKSRPFREKGNSGRPPNGKEIFARPRTAAGKKERPPLSKEKISLWANREGVCTGHRLRGPYSKKKTNGVVTENKNKKASAGKEKERADAPRGKKGSCKCSGRQAQPARKERGVTAQCPEGGGGEERTVMKKKGDTLIWNNQLGGKEKYVNGIAKKEKRRQSGRRKKKKGRLCSKIGRSLSFTWQTENPEKRCLGGGRKAFFPLGKGGNNKPSVCPHKVRGGRRVTDPGKKRKKWAGGKAIRGNSQKKQTELQLCRRGAPKAVTVYGGGESPVPTGEKKTPGNQMKPGQEEKGLKTGSAPIRKKKKKALSYGKKRKKKY